MTKTEIKRNITYIREDLRVIEGYVNKSEPLNERQLGVLRDFALDLLGDVTALCTCLDEKYNAGIYD